MGYGAWVIDHRAWGMGYVPWGMEHGTWGMPRGVEASEPPEDYSWLQGGGDGGRVVSGVVSFSFRGVVSFSFGLRRGVVSFSFRGVVSFSFGLRRHGACLEASRLQSYPKTMVGYKEGRGEGLTTLTPRGIFQVKQRKQQQQVQRRRKAEEDGSLRTFSTDNNNKI